MERKHSAVVYIVGIILIAMVIMLASVSMKAGTTQSSSYKVKVNSLDEIKRKVSFELDFPSFIYNEDNLNIECIMGQIVEISNERITLKASNFVDNNADVLGLYEEDYEIDEKHEYVENQQNISFFRYRSSESTTVINWVKNNTAYGISINENLDIGEAKKLIEIDTYALVDIAKEQETNNKDEYEMLESQNVKYKLPSDINITAERVADEAIYYLIDNNVALIVAYNNPDKYVEATKDNCITKLFNGVYFIYTTEDKLTEEQRSSEDYCKFMELLDETLSSISTIR